MTECDLSLGEYLQAWRRQKMAVMWVALLAACTSFASPPLTGSVYQATVALDVGRPIGLGEIDGAANRLRDDSLLQDIAKSAGVYRSRRALGSLMTVDGGGTLLRINVRGTNHDHALAAAKLFANRYVPDDVLDRVAELEHRKAELTLRLGKLDRQIHVSGQRGQDERPSVGTSAPSRRPLSGRVQRATSEVSRSIPPQQPDLHEWLQTREYVLQSLRDVDEALQKLQPWNIPLVSAGVKPLSPWPIFFHRFLAAGMVGWLAAALFVYVAAAVRRAQLGELAS